MAVVAAAASRVESARLAGISRDRRPALRVVGAWTICPKASA